MSMIRMNGLCAECWDRCVLVYVALTSEDEKVGMLKKGHETGKRTKWSAYPNKSSPSSPSRSRVSRASISMWRRELRFCSPLSASLPMASNKYRIGTELSYGSDLEDVSSLRLLPPEEGDTNLASDDDPPWDRGFIGAEFLRRRRCREFPPCCSSMGSSPPRCSDSVVVTVLGMFREDVRSTCRSVPLWLEN